MFQIVFHCQARFAFFHAIYMKIPSAAQIRFGFSGFGPSEPGRQGSSAAWIFFAAGDAADAVL
jgi:hypothetical protein